MASECECNAENNLLMMHFSSSKVPSQAKIPKTAIMATRRVANPAKVANASIRAKARPTL
jgi:hypothetical protein